MGRKRAGLRPSSAFPPVRMRGTLTFGADSSTAVYDSIETGLSSQSGYKWELLGASIQPNSPSDQGNYASGLGLGFQVLAGEKTAWQDAEDESVICQGNYSAAVATDGGMFVIWPLRADVPIPLPIYTNKLTFLMKGTNNTFMASKEYVWTLYYRVAPCSVEEIASWVRAYGNQA